MPTSNTSSTRSPTSSSASATCELADARAGNRDQVRGVDREHGIGGPGGGPHRLVAQQGVVDHRREGGAQRGRPTVLEAGRVTYLVGRRLTRRRCIEQCT